MSKVPCIYMQLLMSMDDAQCLCIYEMLAVPYSSVSLGGGMGSFSAPVTIVSLLYISHALYRRDSVFP